MGSIHKGTFGNKRASTVGKEISHRHVEKNAIQDPKGNALTKLAKVTVRKTVAQHNGKTVRAETELPGGVHGDAFAQGPSLRVSGAASARAMSFKSVDLSVSLNIDAKAVKAGAYITKEFPFEVDGEKFKVKVKLGPEGYVGANGNVNLHFKVSPSGVRVQLGASGFAGARGALAGNIEIYADEKKLVSSTARLTFSAGVGAGASFDVGPGRFSAKAYAVAGVGVGFSMKGSVNAGNMLKELPELLPDPIERKVDATVNTAKNVIADVKEEASDDLDAAKRMGRDGFDRAKRAVGTAKRATENAAHTASSIGHDGFDGAKKVASKLNPFD